jgi:inorganic pyrophosphatase/exopolyphosphatase
MASIRQEEGFKEDVQRHIDLIQERFLAEIAERDEIEKNLRELLADKRDLAD